MSVPLPYVVIVLLFVLAGIFSTRKKRGQIYCWFEGEDGTNEDRWISEKAGWVIFRGKKYKVMTERITNRWLTKGIHYLFPTRVSMLSFVWFSQWPRDPKNFGRTVINPQVRNVINKSDLVESYFKTSSPASSKKKSLLENYLPLIMIVALVIMGFYFYTNMQGLAAGLNALQNQINTLTPH